MFIVHHLQNSRSQRIIWLLEEMQLEYELVFHTRDAKSGRAPQGLKDIHPLGRVPMLEDATLVLAETGAIVDYLVEKHTDSPVFPREKDSRIHYLYWKNFAEGSFMNLLSMKLLMHNIVSRTPFPFRPITAFLSSQADKHYLSRSLADALEMTDRHLSRHPWFAGVQFSAADVLMTFMLEATGGYGYSAVEDYLARVRQRPAYLAATRRGAWSAQQHDSYWAFLKK